MIEQQALILLIEDITTRLTSNQLEGTPLRQESLFVEYPTVCQLHNKLVSLRNLRLHAPRFTMPVKVRYLSHHPWERKVPVARS